MSNQLDTMSQYFFKVRIDAVDSNSAHQLMDLMVELAQEEQDSEPDGDPNAFVDYTELMS